MNENIWDISYENYSQVYALIITNKKNKDRI